MHNFSCTLLLVLHSPLIKGYGMNKLASGNCCTKKSSCTKDSPRVISSGQVSSQLRHMGRYFVTLYDVTKGLNCSSILDSLSQWRHTWVFDLIRYQRHFPTFRVEEIIFKHSWNDRCISCDAKIRQRRTDKNDPTTFPTKHFGAKQMTNESPRWATNAPVANSQQNDKDKCWQW